MSNAGNIRCDDKNAVIRTSHDQHVRKCGKVTIACLGYVTSASINIGGFHLQSNDLQLIINTEIFSIMSIRDTSTVKKIMLLLPIIRKQWPKIGGGGWFWNPTLRVQGWICTCRWVYGHLKHATCINNSFIGYCTGVIFVVHLLILLLIQRKGFFQNQITA